MECVHSLCDICIASSDGFSVDFSFYVSFSRDSGFRLFDIKYGGERIVYELSLEEAIAHYAGNDPVQSGT